MSRAFKKINNRHLLIISTKFVNMGVCRSTPPYTKKKTRHRSLFFRVFKFEKKKIKIFTSNLKNGGLRSLRSRKPRKRVCCAHRFIMGLRPKPQHSPFGRSGDSPLKRQVLRSAMSRASVVLRTLDTALALH